MGIEKILFTRFLSLIGQIHEIYPKAKLVLDYYHCREYLSDLAQAQYGKGSQKCRGWVEAALTRLFSNQIDNVLAGINRMKPSSDTAREQIQKTLRYLSNQKEKVDYGSLKRGGYHIGSGGIESSNKFISNVRLKRSGAWWYPTAGTITPIMGGSIIPIIDNLVFFRPGDILGGNMGVIASMNPFKSGPEVTKKGQQANY